MGGIPHRTGLVATPDTHGCRYAFGEAALALNDAPGSSIAGSQYMEEIEEWLRSTEGQTCLKTCKLSELYDQRCQALVRVRVRVRIRVRVRVRARVS